MSNFSHMPHDDEGATERLAVRLLELIATHVKMNGDESEKVACPGCVATALFNAMIAHLNVEDGWDASDFIHAIAVFGTHTKDWLTYAMQNGAISVEEVECNREGVGTIVH